MPWRGTTLPTKGEWIGTKEAAAIWTRATGQTVTQATVRRWCRTEPRYFDGIDVFHIGDRYFIERESLLTAFEERALRALQVVAEERNEERPAT